MPEIDSFKGINRTKRPNKKPTRQEDFNLFYWLDAGSVSAAQESLLASEANCKGNEFYSKTLLISYFKFEGNAVCQLGSALFFY